MPGNALSLKRRTHLSFLMFLLAPGPLKMIWQSLVRDISHYVSGRSVSVIGQAAIFWNIFLQTLKDALALNKSGFDDFMEDDSHPVSSSDPMLSSPAPSTLSSSPSSFYSSDENLSPESIDHLIVWHPSLWIFSLLNVAKTILLAKNWRVFFAQLYIFCY